MSAAPVPPDRIDGGAVVLRRARAADAAAVAAAVGESLDRLRPWMPWATPEQADVEVQGQRIAAEDAKWHDSDDHSFLVMAAGDDTALLGIVGLHRRVGAGALEIGYWLRTGCEGRGVMTSAVRALTSAALLLAGVERVEIHCDEANGRSAAVAQRCGYRLDRVVDDEVSAPGESGRQMVWVYPA